MEPDADIATLLQRLYKADSEHFYGIVCRLCEHNAQEAIPPLIQFLHDLNWERRMDAADGLRKLHAYEAIPALIVAAQDPIDVVRGAAIEALLNLPDVRARDVLKSAFYDPTWEVREVAAGALGAQADDHLVPFLGAVLTNSEERVDVRGNAAYVLGQIPGEKSFQLLVQALTDADPDVRYEAIIALKNQGNPAAIPSLERIVESDTATTTWNHNMDRLALLRNTAQEAIVSLQRSIR